MYGFDYSIYIVDLFWSAEEDEYSSIQSRLYPHLSAQATPGARWGLRFGVNARNFAMTVFMVILAHKIPPLTAII
jgi:hypothetical protein